MTDRAALLDVLLTDPSKTADLPLDEAVKLAVEIAGLLKALELYAVRIPAPVSAPMLLTLPEVALRSRKSTRWWREHWRAELGSAAIRKGRTVLIPDDALDKWMKRT